MVARLGEGDDRTSSGVLEVRADGLVVNCTNKGAIGGLAVLLVDARFAIRPATRKRLAERGISIDDAHAMLNVVGQGSYIRHGQDGRLVELPLEGEVKVLGPHRLVVVIVARQIKRHEVAELEVRKGPRAGWEGKGKVLSLGDSV